MWISIACFTDRINWLKYAQYEYKQLRWVSISRKDNYTYFDFKRKSCMFSQWIRLFLIYIDWRLFLNIYRVLLFGIRNKYIINYIKLIWVWLVFILFMDLRNQDSRVFRLFIEPGQKITENRDIFRTNYNRSSRTRKNCKSRVITGIRDFCEITLN